MPERESPLDDVLENVRAALHARRAKLSERVRRIAEALEAYERSVESHLARGFAAEHGLATPAPAALTPERAVHLLDEAVRALPEYAAPAAASPPEAQLRSVPPSPAQSKAPPPLEDKMRFPMLARAVTHAKVVVIGALAGRDRSGTVPPEIGEQLEWIDTERDGVHAVGNLPQRIRHNRVAAVVILDRAVQHKHTEPVVAAARDAKVPVAFAGQGGKASFLRALEHLEAALTGNS